MNKFEAEIGDVLGRTGPVFASLEMERGRETEYDYRLMHGDKTREDFQAALSAT